MVILLAALARRRAGALASLACLLACAAVAGCARPAPAPPHPLRIALHSDPLTLDPHLRNEALTYSLMRNLYEGLTAFDAEMRTGPALAASWENPNDLTWVFHLRPGVRFHDGRELTAADVVWSIERARTLPTSGFGSYVVAVDQVRARDRHTVELTTRRPYAILLNKLAFVLIVPAGSPPEIRQPVGTGPYRLVSYQPGVRLALRSFDGYWGGASAVSQVDFLPIASQRARVARLLTGDLDLVQEPGAQNFERIRAAPACRVLEQESLTVVFLMLKTQRPPLSDVRVRRAIHLALDRPALVAAVLRGEGHPVGQMDFLPVASQRARVARLLAGDLDVIHEPGAENLERLRAAPRCRVLEQESLTVVFLLLKTQRPPLSDLRVRRAIHLALDRPALVAAVLRGEGHPVGQMVGRSVFGYAPDIAPPPRDLAAARRLLAEAGYPGGIDLDLEFRPGRQAAEIRRQLAEAGIRLRLVERPWRELYPRLLDQRVEFYLGAILAPSADASDLFDAMVHSRDAVRGYGDANFGDYHNATLDALIEESGSTLDMLARRAQLERCMHLLMQDYALIPLYVPWNLFGVRDDVVWQPRRDGYILAREMRRRHP